jgi:crotonobetainyl-CoA:carnitine CoA-transferase CaiB-like acyl-CoA transferase
MEFPMDIEPKILDAIRIITIANNLPGPSAASTLQRMGASVTKLEPPGGDFLEKLCPSWYASLNEGKEILRLDLKSPSGMARLEAMLESCDLLITSIRPSSLRHLSLDWPNVHCRYPRLCQVAIVGYSSREQNRAGHDLTYVASSGLLSPPSLPRMLLADVVGAQRAVSSALALLYAREKGHGAGYAEVSLIRGAEIAAESLRYGLTAPNGILGGGLPQYNLYETRLGWIALAALEPHFWESFTRELGIPDAGVTCDDLRKLFLRQSASEWEEWATRHDIPIVAVQEWV